MKYYNNEDCDNNDLQKSIDLMHYELEINPTSKIFSLLSKQENQRCYILKADNTTNGQNYDEWSIQIRDHIEYAKENNRLSMNKAMPIQRVPSHFKTNTLA